MRALFDGRFQEAEQLSGQLLAEMQRAEMPNRRPIVVSQMYAPDRDLGRLAEADPRCRG
ncbi:MAG: hypothetical protein ACR2PL_25760 [Dehalococcoidia bacterium]